MANNPIPDQSKDFVKSGMVLITDPRADVILNKMRDNDPPKDGSKGGFDDVVEKWH